MLIGKRKLIKDVTDMKHMILIMELSISLLVFTFSYIYTQSEHLMRNTFVHLKMFLVLEYLVKNKAILNRTG